MKIVLVYTNYKDICSALCAIFFPRVVRDAEERRQKDLKRTQFSIEMFDSSQCNELRHRIAFDVSWIFAANKMIWCIRKGICWKCCRNDFYNGNALEDDALLWNYSNWTTSWKWHTIRNVRNRASATKTTKWKASRHLLKWYYRYSRTILSMYVKYLCVCVYIMWLHALMNSNIYRLQLCNLHRTIQRTHKNHWNVEFLYNFVSPTTFSIKINGKKLMQKEDSRRVYISWKQNENQSTYTAQRFSVNLESVDKQHQRNDGGILTEASQRK